MAREDARLRYPWAKWMNGETHRAVEGVDFDSDIATFRNYLYLKAKREEIYVTATIEYGATNSVVFQFFDTVEEQREQRKANRTATGQFGAPTEIAEWVPRCRVCEEPLSPAGQDAGECVVRDDETGKLISKHQNEKDGDR